jgi:hypothetical protein
MQGTILNDKGSTSELVMPGLGPGIHDFLDHAVFKSWMAGPSPAMTRGGRAS